MYLLPHYSSILYFLSSTKSSLFIWVGDHTQSCSETSPGVAWGTIDSPSMRIHLILHAGNQTLASYIHGKLLKRLRYCAISMTLDLDLAFLGLESLYSSLGSLLKSETHSMLRRQVTPEHVWTHWGSSHSFVISRHFSIDARRFIGNLIRSPIL